MKTPSAVLICLIGLSCGGLPTDAGSLRQESQAIINGQDCGPTDAPTAMALIAVVNYRTAQGVGEQATLLLCTGTLIAPDTVLSAAHCVDQNLIAQDLGVTVTGLHFYVSQQADLTTLSEGSNTLPSDAVAVSTFVEDPGFNDPTNGTGLQNFQDISLLFLSTANASVVPEILISTQEASQLVDRASVIIAGWGQQTNTMTPPAGTEGYEKCANTTINQLGATEMQIGAGAGTGYTCHGDSGGPAYMTIMTTTPIKRRLIGVTSHAYDGNYCDVGAVDTRVDAYLSWINTTMTQACTAKARVWCDVPGIIPADYYQAAGSTGTTSGSPGETGTTQGTTGTYVNPKMGCGTIDADGLPLLGLAIVIFRRRFRYPQRTR
jgi:secreted trypsin-like serine protease